MVGERNGRGMAGERHAMCESAFSVISRWTVCVLLLSKRGRILPLRRPYEQMCLTVRLLQ